MEALAMIETRGLTALIEAADVMQKTANVKLVSYESTGDGIMTAFLRGQVADCQIALDAAAKASAYLGAFLSAKLIAYPASDLESLSQINPDI